jgi:hypothetical protein
MHIAYQIIEGICIVQLKYDKQYAQFFYHR